MSRTRRSVALSDPLWRALEVMAEEMGTDVESLLNQAVFTFARFNGYVTPGSVGAHLQGAVAERPAPPPRRERPAPPVASQLGERTEGEVAPPLPSSSVSDGEERSLDEAAQESFDTGRRSEPAEEPPAEDHGTAAMADALDRALEEAAGQGEEQTPEGGSAQADAEPEPEPAAEPEPEAPVEDENTNDGTGQVEAQLSEDDLRSGEEPVAEVPVEELDGNTDSPEAPSAEELVGPPEGARDFKVKRGLYLNAKVTTVRALEREGGGYLGVVHLLDASGALVGRVDLGGEVDPAALGEALADETKDANAWLRLHQQLAGDGHLVPATVALFRAAGNGASAELLKKWLAEHSLPLAPEPASARAKEALEALSARAGEGATSADKAGLLFDAVRQGADVAALVKELALDQDQDNLPRVAVDLIRALKGLVPERKGEFAFAHALVEISLGRPDGVRLALDELKLADAKQYERLSKLNATLYPTWDFWPAHDGMAKLSFPDVKPQPAARDALAFRLAIQKAATRIRQLRDLLKPLGPRTNPWLPPELNELLPKGPLPLKGEDALVLDDWQQRSIPTLLKRLRGEWAGLCWLCWLAGLDKLVLPKPDATPRSSTVLRYALGVRALVLDTNLTGEDIGEHLEGARLNHAKKIADVKWLDQVPGSMDRNTLELALGELRVAMLPVLWADEVERPSPWTPEDPAEELDSEELQEGEEAPAEDVGLEPSEEPEEEQPAGGGQAVAGVWLERDGAEPVLLSGAERFVVGRERTCDVVLASPRVSREHAEILLTDEGVRINDLKSSNGTFFNGERISAHDVADGDEITFGSEAVRFRYAQPGEA